jgi:hypothetical protein
MQYEKTLRLALGPAIVFLLLSLVSVALTTHYWILGDWIVPRGARIQTNEYNERTQTYRSDYTIVYFIDKETDVTIAAGCLGLSAAIMALIAWSTLRKPGMDTQLAAVCSPAQAEPTISTNRSLGQTSFLGPFRHRHDHRQRRDIPHVACPALHKSRRRPVWMCVGNFDDGRESEHQQILHPRSGRLQLSAQVPQGQ